MVQPTGNVVVWRWDHDPYGNGLALEDPSGDGTNMIFNLRFPGQYHDEETRLNYNYYRDYDSAVGRFVESDPIGLDGGINTFTYAEDSPVRWIDPTGRDIAVIENGPTSGNPIGHTAIAVTGAGVYSYGNNTPAGSSLATYVLSQATERNTTIYILSTTPEVDAAVIQYEQQYPNTRLPGDFWSIFFSNNCSVRANGALDAAGVPYPIFNGSTVPPSQPGSAGFRAMAAGATVISIPRGTTTVPPELLQFEPN